LREGGEATEFGKYHLIKPKNKREREKCKNIEV